MTQTTTTDTMSDAERYYHLLEIKNKKIKQQQIAIGFLVLIIVLSSLVGIYAAYLIKPIVSESKTDSLKLALAIEKKQHGIEQSILLNEIEAANRKLQSAIIAKDSLRQRELSLTSTNVTLMKKLRQTLPKECDTVFVLCDEIINVKDSSYSALFDAFQLCADVSETKDSLIVSYQAENVTDSAMLAVSKDETKAANKLARRERNGKRAAIGVGVLMGILYVISNVF